MPTIAEEIASAETPIATALRVGVETLGNNQTIVFTKYLRLVLPIDGFVFWVRSDLVSDGTIKNASQLGPTPVSATPTFSAVGSLHQTSDRRQEEFGTIGANTIIFTSETEVSMFNEVSPVVLFVGTFNGVRFAFSRRNSYYRQADLHHYVGESLDPSLASQLVDDISTLNQRQVVSNSLPVWLSLGNKFPIYPAFLAPENVRPPYGVISIVPESSRALQSVPFIDLRGNSYQLVAEKAKLVTFGVRSDQALDFMNRVFQFSLDTDLIGIMNIPTVRDERQTQTEFAMLALKKSIEFEVSYYQTRIDGTARKFIASSIPTFTPAS